MDTTKLAPGYVHQQFSLGRSKLCALGAEVQKKNKVAGYFTGVGISILTSASFFAELPLKIVEDVALTTINLVGAIFNKGCRKNLPNCGFNIVADLIQVGVVVTCVVQPIFALIAGGLLLAGSLWPKDFSVTATGFENESLRTDAIRKHGLKLVHEACKETARDPIANREILEGLLREPN